MILEGKSPNVISKIRILNGTIYFVDFTLRSIYIVTVDNPTINPVRCQIAIRGISIHSHPCSQTTPSSIVLSLNKNKEFLFIEEYAQSQTLR